MMIGPEDRQPYKLRLSRRQLLKTSLGCAAALPLLNTNTHSTPVQSTNTRDMAYIDADNGPAQKMEGFGASGAWWVNDLINFDSDVQHRVAELLFGQSGIALSAYRYNIGGGGVDVWPGPRAPDTFLVNPGEYDWTQDPGGRLFLRLAAEHKVPVLVGFANSAPAVWTSNHKSHGGYLIPGSERDYARYLADIARHFHDAEGITLTYISPMNEPDYIFGGGVQERMALPPAQRATLVQAVGKALAEQAPYARVTADETSRVALQFLLEVPQWMNVPGTSEYVAALAHHTYDFPGDFRLWAASRVGESFNKPMWMTELCCWNGSGFGPQYDPTMENALWMANTIIRDLTQANDAAWHWWVALSSAMGCDPYFEPDCATSVHAGGWNDGLLYYDLHYQGTGNQQIYFTKRFWTMGNFSRYVRPGALRYGVRSVPEDIRVAAFHDPESSDRADEASAHARWIVVAVNNSGAQRELRLRLPGHPSSLSHLEAHQTSASRDLERVPVVRALSGDQFSAALAARSVTTILLRAHGSAISR